MMPKEILYAPRTVRGREVGSNGLRSLEAFRVAIVRRFGAAHIPAEYQSRLKWTPGGVGWSDGWRDPLEARAGYVRRQLQQIVAQTDALRSDTAAAQRAAAAASARRRAEQVGSRAHRQQTANFAHRTKILTSRGG